MREDLVALGRELNQRGARYFMVGGFAVIMAGQPRATGDIDLLIDASLENEAKVFDALATLPDGCVRELDAGDVSNFSYFTSGARATMWAVTDAGEMPSSWAAAAR